MPHELWHRFLVADDAAADALERLFELADEADVPDNYATSISRDYSQEEVDDFKGTMKPTALFLDYGERESVRRLAWMLMHTPDRALLSEVARRWVEFIEAEGAMLTDLLAY